VLNDLVPAMSGLWRGTSRLLSAIWSRCGFGRMVGGKIVYDDIAARSRQRSNYADATESRTRANTIGMSMFPCFAALHSAVWRCRKRN
jgi:hypothetical protein